MHSYKNKKVFLDTTKSEVCAGGDVGSKNSNVFLGIVYRPESFKK